MNTPIIEPTVLLGSPQWLLQLSRDGEHLRRERPDDASRRQSRERIAIALGVAA